MITLYDYQIDAIKRMSNGSILCGGVGSGKSRTALAYYYIKQGGDINTLKIDKTKIKDLYIITTARKRDTKEWEAELCPFGLTTSVDKIVVDSWNNITKYRNVENAFFIFDEQRVVGYGQWSKAFIKIARQNNWILLSATPGDNWLDYMPVFIANGFYKNKTDFQNQHVVYTYRFDFPKVDRYIETGRLIRLRNKILVDMDFHRETISHHEDIYVDYNKDAYKDLFKNRWNPSKDAPIENASELCYELRKIVNSHKSRLEIVKDIINKKHKVILFYNFDYELELIKEYFSKDSTTEDYFSTDEFEMAEWNGHKHQPIPDSDEWLYLVQYTAGAEGWNCIKTDTIIFFSPNYSYKIMVQSSGRIDRLNTPFRDLYYYHLKTRSGIDLAISKAISEKKKFNESKFIGNF